MHDDIQIELNEFQLQQGIPVSLIQPLPLGPIDIIGDIHGEYDALSNLLGHLNYDLDGNHPDKRTLVFVGDFCDRGPDSPAVLALIEKLVRSKRAVAVLGNHEINLLRGDAKDGSGWFFDERVERDNKKYAPYRRIEMADKANLIAFLSSLPIGLERTDLRVVHAAWIDAAIDAVRTFPIGSLTGHYDVWDKLAHEHVKVLRLRMHEELAIWEHGLEDKNKKPPFMHAHADAESLKQRMNPLRILSSGVEHKGIAPFFSSGKWRFVERVQWWNEYEGAIPVVIGHYWRRFSHTERSSVGKGDPDLFNKLPAQFWHGKWKNVFCVDFSVGGRWSARKANLPLELDFKLAALRWPERTLCFDDGAVVKTHGYLNEQLMPNN